MARPGGKRDRTGRWMRAWGRALVDPQTYDVRANPSLWLGFLLALPIPMLTYAAGAATWLKLLTLLAPMTWAMVLGAAGKVAQQAADQRDELAGTAQQAVIAAVEAQAELSEATEALDEEHSQRVRLEQAKEEVDAELKLAHTIQRTLLPENIQRPECDVYIRNLPSRYIGGDYVHAHVVDDRWLYLVVADVSGHGIAAALVVARIHGLIRRLAFTRKTPVGCLERLNRAAMQIFRDTYYFMTVVVCRVDLTTGVLQYATAGHPAQLLMDAKGTTTRLRTRNRLLGMDPDIFDEHEPSGRVMLDPGDTLVLFTDGLFEILKDGDGEILGESGLHARIQEAAGEDARRLVKTVLRDVAAFQGHTHFDDDVTLVAMRWKGPTDARASADEG